MLKWFTNTGNILITIWVILSTLIIICVSLFRINDYVDHPQHGIFDNFEEVSQFIKSNGSIFIYILYFILDFFWAFFLLSIIGYLLTEMDKKKLFSFGPFNITLFTLFAFFAVFAFIFDTVEGFCYIFYWGKYLKTIANIKTVLYIFCFTFFVYWLLKKFVLPSVKSILRFTKTSFLSIVFILLVYALIAFMPQGSTLIVHLVYSPLDILLFFFMLSFLAIILSHYPIYVDMWANADNDCVKLKMGKRGIRFLGFGIIYYATIKNNTPKVITYNDKKVISLRRSLGILLYVGVLNIFLGIAARFFDLHFNVASVTLLILAVTLIVYNFFGEEEIEWKNILKKEEYSEKEKEAVVHKIVKYVRWFPAYFIFSSGLVLLTALVSSWVQWNRITLILIFITLAFQMFLYVFFRISRTYFKYVFYSEKLKAFNPDMFNPVTEQLFKKYHPRPHLGKYWLYSQFGKLSDNIQYLQMMQLSGYSALIFLLIANFSFSFASSLNPINIILLYIIFYYSIIIITFKHILYYHRSPESPKAYREFFKFGIPILTMMFIVWAAYNSTLENDLHELTLVEKEQEPMEYEDYLYFMTGGTHSELKKNYFFVGSYGGGLKANLWNLLLLYELEKATNEQFLRRTLAMSGVSGGAVGIGNFASLVYEQDDSITIKNNIRLIGNSNVLSNEITYLLGKDWIREYIPYFEYNGTDRSYKSMENHALHTGMGGHYNQIGYTDYWRKIFADKHGRFPALIMNTTSMTGKQGVASTVKFPENTFPAADLITEFTGKDSIKTLTYYGAVSTTNRFPLFSPTAKIPNKGNYLDGGYFENSGMLSVLEIYDAIAGDSTKLYFKKINPVFINIINSEDYYIAEKIKEWEFEKRDLSEAGEFAAILGTVASIDKLPRYVFEKIRARGFAVEPVMMPHKITYNKVKNVLNADVDDPIRLMELIKVHNSEIDSVLKRYKFYDYESWGVVQPPLARVLSEPAVRYQEAMVKHHPAIKSTLQRIYEYVKSDTLVTRELQDNLKQQPFSQYRMKKF